MRLRTILKLYAQNWIGRRCNCAEWPSRSPDLTPCSFAIMECAEEKRFPSSARKCWISEINYNEGNRHHDRKYCTNKTQNVLFSKGFTLAKYLRDLCLPRYFIDGKDEFSVIPIYFVIKLRFTYLTERNKKKYEDRNKISITSMACLTSKYKQTFFL